MTPPDFRDIVAAAVADHKAGRLSAAEAGYRAALALSPDRAALLHNLGVIAVAQGDREAASAYLDRAVAADPRYALAQFSRALLLYELGDVGGAIDGLERVCALEPDNYEAHRRLGFLWLARARTDRALDHFARTYELRRGEGGTAASIRSLTWSTRDKLLHDAEQFRFLAGVRAGTRFTALAGGYESIARGFPAEASPLSGTQIETLGDDYNTAIHIADAPAVAGRAVTARHDVADLSARIAADGVAEFDDFLTPEAHAGLRRYLLHSTIWHDFIHIDGFVAAYLEDGLACPLLLQIAHECRTAFPELAAHRLSQAWAFKGLRPSSAVDAHADDAVFSINFWITPDVANRAAGAGGMSVCTVPPPVDWPISDYAGDRERVVSFLAQNAGRERRIAYRDNRGVLFRSRLFHRSDSPIFASGYENHRINLTLLFGDSGRGSCPVDN